MGMSDDSFGKKQAVLKRQIEHQKHLIDQLENNKVCDECI